MTEDDGDGRALGPSDPSPVPGLGHPASIPVAGDDVPRKVKFDHWNRIDLKGGRSVAVARSDDGEHTVLRFRNDRGTETRVCISSAAAEALRTLLNAHPWPEKAVYGWTLNLINFLAQAGEAEGPRPEGARGEARARDPEGDAPKANGESSGEDRG